MKPSIIVLLFLSLVIFRSVADLQDWHGGDFNLLQKSTKGPGSRSLLEHDKHDIQPNHDKAILSLRDGTFCLMAKDSPNALWCFSTGSSISNLYQDDRNDDSAKKKTSVLDEEMELDRDDIMVDLGRGYDVELSTEFGETNLLNSVAEYVRSTPHISKDGITLGEKRTTVFLLDANDGTLINAFNLGGFSPRLGVPSDGDHNALPKKLGESTPTDLQSVKLLYVTRNDYLLQHYAPISRKVLWNLTFSEIQAYFPHPQRKLQLPVIHVRDGALVRFLYEKFKIKDGNTMLLPSLSTAIVVAESVDQNALPQRVSGSTDQNSPSLVIASDIDRNSLSRKEKYIHFSYNDNVVLCLLALLVAVLCYMGIKSIRRKKSIKQLNDSNGNQTAAPKRKKPRKVGSSKSGANNKSIDKGISSEEADTANQFPNTERNGKEPWLDFGIPADDGSNGRIVGKLYISNTEIAKGSDGTIVFEGKYDGRPVAVKRLVKAHHKVAYKEIQHLIASDRHPNIVRWYGAEHDADFVYLSLERCTCSLNDLIQICSVSSQNVMKSVNGYTVQLDSVKGINMDVELWKANAYPSTQLLKLMRDIVSGLAHLHELGIIHRDLKPQNILIIKERSLCAKLSDMGISKRLLGDNASLGHHPTGLGSSGWQAPEQLLNGRQTRAVDLFSLGCVLFFCITGGKHPYGEYFERDQNIVKNQVDLFVVEHIPEAVDLLSHLLDSNPELRLTAVDVVHHPLFWSSEMRLSFLRDASDRVELEDRENDSDILKALESAAPVALGGNWDQKMEAAFLNNIGRYRRYKFDSSRDLLRVMRNKLNHYRELPKEIQEILGAVPDGFDEYFTSRFPKFLVEVYKVVQKYCREEEWFQKYFRSSLV